MSNPTPPQGWNVLAPSPEAPQQFSLIQRIAMRLTGIQPAALVARSSQPAPRSDVPTQAPAEPYLTAELRAWDAALSLQNTDRLSRYREYDAMDHGDVASQLDAIVDAVLVSDDARERAFKAYARGMKKINNIVQDTIERLDLQSKVRQFLRDLLKYGDVPIAFWFDNSESIIALQNMDAAVMRRRVDRYGRLLAGTSPQTLADAARAVDVPNAYWQVSNLTAASSTSSSYEQPINGWLPWQMVWLRWRVNDKRIYSDGSYVEDMRRDWLKLRFMEAAMVIARGSRAYPRRIYMLDTTGKNTTEKQRAIDTFKSQLGLAETFSTDPSGNVVAGVQIKNPLDVSSDIYIATAYTSAPDGSLVPQLNDVKLEDPRLAGIEHIGDIKYFREKLYRRVSAGLMGVEVHSPEPTMQDIASARMYQHCADTLEYGLIRPVLRLQCALKGYALDDGDLQIEFSSPTVKSSWRHSDAAFRASMADKNRLSAGVTSVKALMQENDNITDDYWAAHLDQLRAEQKLRDEGVLPPLDGGTKTGAREIPNQDQARKGNNSA